ncbi:MAG: 50S ribosomal protein L23 [Candidatus Moranbacteria bacterium]|nr:50S ribosomal protein L23 [Candidatus Moranbacteria bacterium]
MGLFGKKKIEDKIEGKEQEVSQVVVDEKKAEKKNNGKKIEVPTVGDSYGVVISPIVTEKSHSINQEGKYLFRVSSKANKRDIKRAIENMYKVDVDKVNVLTVSKKKRTIKYDRGYQKAYKKAIVTLKKGQSIIAFEGV